LRAARPRAALRDPGADVDHDKSLPFSHARSKLAPRGVEQELARLGLFAPAEGRLGGARAAFANALAALSMAGYFAVIRTRSAR